MNTHHGSTRLAGAVAPSRIATRLLIAMAFLITACGDVGSPLEASSRLGSLNNNSLSAVSNFAVLANAAVTCTDGTIVGDVGTFQATPTGSFTQTLCPVEGEVHVGDAVAVQAYEEFLSVYAALAPQAGDVCETLTGTLDGVILAPGSYCFDAAAALTGVLTLEGSASDSWLFKIGTGGTGALTGTNFSVVLANGAQACNVTWWVAEAATMTTSSFQGSILAGAGITLTGGSFNGNVNSQADVTITGTALSGCEGSNGGGDGNDNGDDNEKCNQGVGNGSEGCDPGNSNNRNTSNDENGGTPGNPGRTGSN